MKKQKKNIFVLILACGLIFIGCEKKKIQGPPGDPGAPGVGGNAALSSTTVFEVQSSQWLIDTITNSRRVILSRPEITKDIVTKGAVKIYKQTQSTFVDPSWAPLPLVQGDLFTQFGYGEGQLVLDFINIEGGMPAAPATSNFRMVLLSEMQ